MLLVLVLQEIQPSGPNGPVVTVGDFVRDLLLEQVSIVRTGGTRDVWARLHASGMLRQTGARLCAGCNVVLRDNASENCIQQLEVSHS